MYGVDIEIDNWQTQNVESETHKPLIKCVIFHSLSIFHSFKNDRLKIILYIRQLKVLSVIVKS